MSIDADDLHGEDDRSTAVRRTKIVLMYGRIDARGPGAQSIAIDGSSARSSVRRLRECAFSNVLTSTKVPGALTAAQAA